MVITLTHRDGLLNILQGQQSGLGVTTYCLGDEEHGVEQDDYVKQKDDEEDETKSQLVDPEARAGGRQNGWGEATQFSHHQPETTV